MKNRIIAVLLSVLLLSGCSNSGSDVVNSFAEPNESSTSESADDRPASMIELSSEQLAASIRIGWNLGKTLDVCIGDLDGDGEIDSLPDKDGQVVETLWGNPYATRELFKALMDSGVNAVRIPVTWRDHLDSSGQISPSWLNRVEQVVDYAYNCGMYVIINVYNDGAGDTEQGAWLRSAADDPNAVLAKYRTVWEQIAQRFQNYSERLLFESMDMVGFDSLVLDDAYRLLNRFNQEFVNVIRESGGNNPKRHLLVAGYWADIEMTCDDRFVLPADPAGKTIVSVHYYTPWQFCTTGDQSEWGSEKDEKLMEKLVGMMNTKFISAGTAVIITEYAARGSDEESVVYYCEKLVKLCENYGIGAFLWDDGSFFDREACRWRNPELIEALLRATSGADYTPQKLD